MASIPSNIPTKKPVTRTTSARAVVFALAGAEPKYPAYRFARRAFLEKQSGHDATG